MYDMIGMCTGRGGWTEPVLLARLCLDLKRGRMYCMYLWDLNDNEKQNSYEYEEAGGVQVFDRGNS